MPAWNHFIGVITDVGCYWRERPLKRALLDAKHALGERMIAVGIDDGHLLARIALLDERIRQANEARAFTPALKSERKMLVLQLADAALEEEAPMPGAEHEYGQAKAAQAALGTRYR